MKVYKVGRYYTTLGRTYADGMRGVVALSGTDPGEPVEMEMELEEWARLTPTAIAVKDPQP